MRKFVSCFAICMFVMPVVAATPAGQSRRATMAAQMTAPSPRAASAKYMPSMASMPTANTTVNMVMDTAPVTVDKSSVRVETTEDVEQVVEKDMREKEKFACLNNNIGIGNTFVWASRFSNVNNYASMVEDVENPENNTCFVRVELKSNDSRINVSDIPSQYFEFGRGITCGSWADADMLEDRILAAKKTARTWGTVAGVVGGAAVGVGAMELFGNKLIGGAVEGQKALSGNELLRSQLLVLRDEDGAAYNSFVRDLNSLVKECKNTVWDGQEKPEDCEKALEYEALLTQLPK